MKPKPRIAVLVSGNGSNLQAIIDQATRADFPAKIALVISNNEKAYALERAKRAHIPAVCLSHSGFSSREDHEIRMLEEIEKHQCHFVVLAGFMRLLSPLFVRKFPSRLINLHPSLLPAFKGAHAIEEAWNYGTRVTGVTVHFVDEQMDTGPIILQEVVAITPNLSLKELKDKIHQVEHHLLPAAIELLVTEKLEIVDRKVLIKTGEL